MFDHQKGFLAFVGSKLHKYVSYRIDCFCLYEAILNQFVSALFEYKDNGWISSQFSSNSSIARFFCALPELICRILMQTIYGCLV